MADDWGWVDQREEQIADERAKGYFDIKEGKQQFILLSHCAPLAQVYEGGKYRAAQEGDKNVSVKGLCWVLQDGLIKQAKLPYTLVKVIRGIQQDPEWDFKLPFPHQFTLEAVNAGSKEVKYTLNPSPKTIEIPKEVLEEFAKKPKPEEIVERIKGQRSGDSSAKSSEDTRDVPPPEYPAEDIDPKDIPF